MDHLQSMRVFVRVADLGSFVSPGPQARWISPMQWRRATSRTWKPASARACSTARRAAFRSRNPVRCIWSERQILDELEDVEQMEVARNHEPLDSLRIVAPVVFGLHNLAPVLQTYAQRYPKVIPDVTLVDRQVDLVDRCRHRHRGSGEERERGHAASDDRLHDGLRDGRGRAVMPENAETDEDAIDDG